jgi:chaperonin GroEL
MAKQLLFDEDSRHALKKGSDRLAEAVNLTRSALQNAASIAAMILKTDSLITDVPEKERPAVLAMPEY